MAEDKKTSSDKNVQKIKPQLTEHAALPIAKKEILIPDGKALIIPLDSDGKEMEDKYFFYDANTADRYYNPEKFIIKKKKQGK